MNHADSLLLALHEAYDLKPITAQERIENTDLANGIVCHFRAVRRKPSTRQTKRTAPARDGTRGRPTGS